MREPKRKSVTLTIFLIKNEILRPKEILSDYELLKVHDVSKNGRRIGHLYTRPSFTHPPRWLSLFQAAVRNRIDDLFNSSASAIFLVARQKRTFAVAFGYGRYMLEPGSWEENFGLHVTLNSIDPGKIRSLDRQSFDALSRHTRTQTSREGTITDFGVDVEQDLLRAVMGKPSDARLGTQLTGMDALKTTVKVELSEIPALLDLYLQKSQETSYRTNFPWVDQLSEVRDVIDIDLLNRKLVDKINLRDFDRLWLAVPEIIDWNDVAGFKYSHAPQTMLHDDIHIETFLASVQENSEVTFESLKTRNVLCLGHANDMPIRKWPVYQCLYSEIDWNGNTYLINAGKWYRGQTDFVQHINEAILKIPLSETQLPDYSDASEELYNERVYKGDTLTFALMDRKSISHGGGTSQIEFCDLYTTGKRMIHVKRYGASSVLSHLFAQGVVSARLLIADPEFRKKVNEKLPKSHQLSSVAHRPRPEEFEVVFAIVSSSKEERISLPLFSRINLRNASRELAGYGLKVSLAVIRVSESE